MDKNKRTQRSMRTTQQNIQHNQTKRGKPKMREKNNLKILEQQPTENKPYVVENYPYGFKRTQIRYWTETTKRGQRFVSQTLNPKTKQWNKPKKSVYSNILLIGLNEKGHISYTTIGVYSLEESKRFKEKYEKYFNEYQKKEMLNIIGIEEVIDTVEFKIRARRFKNKETGEITECIPIFEMDKYQEIDENGNNHNEEEYQKKQKELTKEINKIAVLNASKKTNVNSAIETFKRS